MSNPNWKPGVSGNPSGRPRGAAGLAREIAKRTNNGNEVLDYVLSVLRDEHARDYNKQWAADWLANRMFGKPLTPIELNGVLEERTVNLIGTVDLNALADAELDALVPVLTRMIAPPAKDGRRSVSPVMIEENTGLSRSVSGVDGPSTEGITDADLIEAELPESPEEVLEG